MSHRRSRRRPWGPSPLQLELLRIVRRGDRTVAQLAAQTGRTEHQVRTSLLGLLREGWVLASGGIVSTARRGTGDRGR